MSIGTVSLGLFALGHCRITSAYFHRDDNSLICSTYSIGILKGYLETQGPGGPEEKTTMYSAPLCAVLYSKVFKQVVSGCLSGMVSVWEVVTGRRMMEFSVTDDQHVELTAMSLDESEGCLLMGLRDGTIKMWNYSVGECLLTFPNPDQMEISGIVRMNKVLRDRMEFHKTKLVLLCYHWQTFHTEDVLSMAKYHKQFLGTSSYNGDILFWNTSMFKPVLNFSASQSPLPLLPKRVQDVDDCLTESHGASKPCVEQKWAHKTHTQPQSPGARSVANTHLRRNLMSAPPVVRHQRDKEPAPPAPLQIIFLQTRPCLPHTAALLSSCMDGYIYAWSIHGSGGLLGKFPVDFEEKRDVVVGAMATDENDWILVTGDCQGHIKVVAGQTISLVPPKLLITWKGHLESVADILYVDSFQLSISAGQDQDVKAWKLSGDAIGRFGLSVWKMLQDAPTVSDQELKKSSEEEGDFIDTTQKAFHLDLQEKQDLAEALTYQRREQVALMALLNGKADTEAEAWVRLRKITLMSPWAGERSPEDTENSWHKWESKGKQASKVMGAAYKPRERSQSPGLLFTNVQYGWMKHQILPQIYQSLHFNELVPIQQPDSVMHKVADQQGRLALLATQRIQKDLDPGREMVPDSAASTPTAVASSPGSLSLSASDSSFLAHLPAAAAPAPAPPLLASALVSPQAQSAPAVLLQKDSHIRL
ncbi:WD repeat-containing protein on Y chromosome [Camelus ferus]|nr:WD repeat-containing protein on Y chromosome [Camelus ferus]